MGVMALLVCTEEIAPGLPLSAVSLTRASLDVRGVRPSAADISAVVADPSAGEALVAEYLADDRFGDRVQGAFASVYLTRADESDIADAEYALPDEAEFLVAMGEEPLRILGTIAREDLPYTEIVRADWTMADEVLAGRFPVTWAEGATGWQKVAYTDARPRAGILSSSGLWWRYQTTSGNANRGRANALMRILTCQDFLSTSIEVDPELDLLDDNAVRDALHTNPGCVACHYSLDPLGAYLWGTYVELTWNISDLSYYHPEREHLWEEYGSQVAPAYYGEPGEGVGGLGVQIASDPRLITCIVSQVREVLLRRTATLEESDHLTAHREAFLAGGLTLRSVYAAVMAEDAYRATDEEAPWKLVTPDLYASQLEDLTGFRFTSDGRDVLTYDSFGLRTLAGGGRSVYGSASAVEPTPTGAVVVERLAQTAANHVVAADRADPENARLFTVSFTETPTAGRDAMIAQIQVLYLRVLGQSLAADADEVTDCLTLWEDLYALDGDSGNAWAGVLTVLLRHPDFLVY